MGILECCLAFELFASIANSRFRRGFYNVFWLWACLRTYRIRVFTKDSILLSAFRAVCEHKEFAFFNKDSTLFYGFQAVCEHSEFAFSTGILHYFLAFEFFARIANSCFQRGVYTVFWLSSCLRANRIRVFSTGIL